MRAVFLSREVMVVEVQMRRRTKKEKESGEPTRLVPFGDNLLPPAELGIGRRALATSHVTSRCSKERNEVDRCPCDGFAESTSSANWLFCLAQTDSTCSMASSVAH